MSRLKVCSSQLRHRHLPSAGQRLVHVSLATRRPTSFCSWTTSSCSSGSAVPYSNDSFQNTWTTLSGNDDDSDNDDFETYGPLRQGPPRPEGGQLPEIFTSGGFSSARRMIEHLRDIVGAVNDLAKNGDDQDDLGTGTLVIVSPILLPRTTWTIPSIPVMMSPVFPMWSLHSHYSLKCYFKKYSFCFSKHI